MRSSSLWSLYAASAVLPSALAVDIDWTSDGSSNLTHLESCWRLWNGNEKFEVSFSGQAWYNAHDPGLFAKAYEPGRRAKNVPSSDL